jgi:mRNA-degrading endonuclease RelE of RelBE toxin-antitoxin system
MRNVRYSKTFLDQLNELLRQGVAKFGKRVVMDKQALVYDAIDNHLAHFPRTAGLDRRLGLYVYAISQTPFVVLYDFDDDELRVYFIVHGRADRRLIDRTTVAW